MEFASGKHPGTKHHPTTKQSSISMEFASGKHPGTKHHPTTKQSSISMELASGKTTPRFHPPVSLRTGYATPFTLPAGGSPGSSDSGGEGETST
jgi:hypothetical protein